MRRRVVKLRETRTASMSSCPAVEREAKGGGIKGEFHLFVVMHWIMNAVNICVYIYGWIWRTYAVTVLRQASRGSEPFSSEE